MVRPASARKFVLSKERVKKPFLWFQLVDFDIRLYGIHNQMYCHFVVPTMTILSLFGAMCRNSDVNRLRWRNVQIDNYLKYFGITFKRRNNSQFRQGNKVAVVAIDALVCSLKLLLKLKLIDVNYSPDSFLFRGFNSRLVAKNPHKTIPFDLAIKYAQYMRYLSLWFGSVIGLSIIEFKTQLCSHLGQIGAASTTSNAGIHVEFLGQHGDWASFKSQERYMKRDMTYL